MRTASDRTGQFVGEQVRVVGIPFANVERDQQFRVAVDRGERVAVADVRTEVSEERRLFLDADKAPNLIDLKLAIAGRPDAGRLPRRSHDFPLGCFRGEAARS